MDFDRNVWYYPENCGLEVVTSIEEDLSYEFHILAVWYDPKSKTVLFAEDSGCSCPAPFEDYHFNSIEDHNLESGIAEALAAIDAFGSCPESEKETARNRINTLAMQVAMGEK